MDLPPAFKRLLPQLEALHLLSDPKEMKKRVKEIEAASVKLVEAAGGMAKIRQAQGVLGRAEKAEAAAIETAQALTDEAKADRKKAGELRAELRGKVALRSGALKTGENQLARDRQAFETDKTRREGELETAEEDNTRRGRALTFQISEAEKAKKKYRNLIAEIEAVKARG